jgi:hypothetical protein
MFVARRRVPSNKLAAQKNARGDSTTIVRACVIASSMRSRHVRIYKPPFDCAGDVSPSTWSPACIARGTAPIPHGSKVVLMTTNARIATSLLLIVLAGCASAPSTRLDNEAFGGHPYVPASGAVVPDPPPAPPVTMPVASVPVSAATVHATDAPVEAPSPDPALEPAPPVPVDEGSVDRNKEPWEFVLFGSGASDKDVSHGNATLSGSLGYFLGEHFELALRQDVWFSDTPGTGSNTHAASRLAADFVFGSGTFQPFLGGNIGYVYGQAVRDTWEAAPEGGIKLFLRPHVFLQLMAEYQFFFQSDDEVNAAFDNGSWVYSLGLGMTF